MTEMSGQSLASHLSEAKILEELLSFPEELKNDDRFSSCHSIGLFNMGEQPVDQALQCLQMHFGTFQHVQEKTEEGQRKSEHIIVFEEGLLAASISLDTSNERVMKISFDFPSGVLPISLDDTVAKLQKWSGQHNLLVLENESVLAEHNSELPLAVGSAFKLFVLSALKQQIDRGERDWADIIHLNPEWKSYPSGILQDWVDGSPLTLNTLASLMISISDNTAADHLLHLVSRETVENLTERNRPFLTTQQLFKLKVAQNRHILDQYRKSKSEAERRKYLSEVVDQSPLPDLSDTEDWTDPVALDVEWIFSAVEMRDVMATVKSLPLMSINPFNAVEARDWARIAFKGGSEPGVINMTIWLQAPNGKTFYVILTANDKDAPLNNSAWILVAARIIETLKKW